MQEAFLHYIWQFQYFNKSALTTTTDEAITVFHPGYRNIHSGPDFSNARIKIGHIEWIGHVEIHIHSSGWIEHHHESDAAYDNVILHVVWAEDKVIARKDHSSLPTLELKPRVASTLILRYRTLFRNPESIPCASSVGSVASVTKLDMVEKAMVTRLERNAVAILHRLGLNTGDWEETCYQLLCRNFGFKVNSDPFLALSKAVPCKVIMKHQDRQIQVEAMLFGQAGLLDESIDDPYYQVLQREYHLLSRKFNLSERKLNKVQWRFLRLRPANFPTIRIAQLAALLSSHQNIFSRLIGARSYRELLSTLSVRQSEYWVSHYLFGKIQHHPIPPLGKMSADNIIINTVIPLIAAFGKAKDDPVIADRALAILTEVPCEENMIIRRWSELNFTVKTAFDSQGLIELYNNFCTRRRCLDCSIGSALIRPH
jgi:hypothetical protein